MRRHLPALTLLALALTLFAVPVGAAGADPGSPRGIPPEPVVGQCHDLTAAEAQEDSDPDAPVPCDGPHTSITVRVVQLTDPDWTDSAALWRQAGARCYKGWVAALGSAKAASLSAYDLFWFIPTEAERSVGVAFIRCDAALLGGRRLLPLPLGDSIDLGTPPLPDKLARCRTGKKSGYLVTACWKKHVFRATYAIKYPSTTWPGWRKLKRFAYRKCRARIDTDFFYEWPPSKQAWKGGLRYVVCLPRNRG